MVRTEDTSFLTTQPVLDLSSYGLVIDARTSSEHVAGHLSGAINLPVITDDQYGELSELRSDARGLRYVSLGLLNIADWIDQVISKFSRHTRILVYSSHGSHRTKLWADALDVIGFKVDVLPVGYEGLHSDVAGKERLPKPYAMFRHIPRLRLVSDVMNSLHQYSITIDARSEREFLHDHIPGAVNLPVVDTSEYAEVGTLHRQEKDAYKEPFRAYMIGVSYSLRNISHSIDGDISKLPAGSPVLVYCFRGGKRSRLWHDPLKILEFSVDRIDCGWKAYRRWVVEQLTHFPKNFRFRVLCGPTGCGKTRLLNALREVGAQILDLEALAKHRGSIIGAIPGIAQPSQKMFESDLLQTLRGFTQDRPVWVESESKKIGDRNLPEALTESMRTGNTIYVNAAMPARVKLWREDYRHFEEDPEALVSRLAFLKPLVGGEEFADWTALAGAGRIAELFERLMVSYYDPLYSRSLSRQYPSIETSPRVFLEDLGYDALRSAAKRLLCEEV